MRTMVKVVVESCHNKLVVTREGRVLGIPPVKSHAIQTSQLGVGCLAPVYVTEPSIGGTV